jgi:hypothetical protein
VSLYHHFTPLRTAVAELVPGEIPLALDCLKPHQWSEHLPDVCVWLTSNPSPEPAASNYRYVRITLRLPRGYRLERPFIPDFGDVPPPLLRRMRLEWRCCYREIPAEYFVDATTTREPWWRVPA